jgi:flagellar motor switch protein FliN/FliY
MADEEKNTHEGGEEAISESDFEQSSLEDKSDESESSGDMLMADTEKKESGEELAHRETAEPSKYETTSGVSVAKESRNIDLILDIPLQVTVELGKTKMLINDLLQLGQGSVIELTKLVGEPLEVLVNDKLVAKGEVVVVNEKFGIRLTDIASPVERIESLK